MAERRRHPIVRDRNRLARGKSRRPATRGVLRAQAKSKRPSRSRRLLVRAIEDGLGTLGYFEIGRHREQGSIRLGARDVRKLEGLLANAGVASLAVNDGLEIGRSPNFSDDADRLVIADLARWDGPRRAHAGHKDALHRLRTEVFSGGLSLIIR